LTERAGRLPDQFYRLYTKPGWWEPVRLPIPNVATSPAQGSATLTDAQAADLLAGRYYINVYTAANPAGEIRGQVIK
jgi:hypothetical protein